MKSAILITARLKSTRLPRKVVKEIKGRSMLCHMIDRLKLAKRPDEIVLITSDLEEDMPLVDIAKAEGISYFRGHPDDVLRRMTDAAAEFGVDTIISCTADNPFTDALHIDKLIDFHLTHSHDYTKTEGLPWGTFTYCLSHPAMVRACEIKDMDDTEVWGGYFTETGIFKWGTMKVEDPRYRWPDLRLSVDFQEDFEIVSRIFDGLYEPGKVFSLEAIIAFCREHPELPEINANVEQKPGLPIKVKANMGNVNG
ncbi:cytidylyltransferase domain-containing protein [Candidatus Hydrogenedentota bacterium]